MEPWAVDINVIRDRIDQSGVCLVTDAHDLCDALEHLRAAYYRQSTASDAVTATCHRLTANNHALAELTADVISQRDLAQDTMRLP